tara:strand:- start:208 stop:411 length:204 start_codon:yes stop_codon:yes gene_type:complete
MNWKERLRYRTAIGKWWFKLDAECKLVFFAGVIMLLCLGMVAWDLWLRGEDLPVAQSRTIKIVLDKS